MPMMCSILLLRKNFIQPRTKEADSAKAFAQLNSRYKFDLPPRMSVAKGLYSRNSLLIRVVFPVKTVTGRVVDPR